MSDIDFNQFNKGIIEEFRANSGAVGGDFEGAPMVLLTTTGAKSGRSHTTPLVYGTDGDQVFVVASKGGAPTNPAWFHNLVANPTVEVEIGEERFGARAEVAGSEERRRLFDIQAERMPNFREYETKTTREIPVVVLHRES